MSSRPKRGNLHGEFVETVEQVPAKLVLADRFEQVLVRRGDDPYVDGRFPHAADGTDHAFLNRAEQLYLYVVRQVADLVEENGSAFRRLEDALFVRNGRRKGSFGMSEQLAGGQLAREHAAVDGDERTGLPLAVGVDEAGRVFLARAAFARDQNRHVGRRDEQQVIPELGGRFAVSPYDSRSGLRSGLRFRP